MKQRYISLLMALVLTLTTVLAPVPAALAGGMSALYVDGKAYEGEDLFVGWNYYKGDFDHYEYSVNDLTLDEDTAEIFRVNIGQETSINIPGELIINRHHYRVWVGACDASGNALDSSKTEFYGVSRQKDEELVLSISEAYAGQNVKISWNKIEEAERYEYTLLDLTADEYLEEREPISKCYFTLYGEDVYGAHEYKLWVGAIDGNGDVICQNIQYFTPIACSHGNTSHVESSRTCVSISDKQHSVTQVYDEMCLDCGETIATGLTETFDEKHVLDANGDCTLCDLRVSCPHTEKRYEEMINAYADENENEHTHDIQYSEYCANPVCGKLLRLQADEKRVYTHEAHSFENDVCTKCGRIRADELKITVARNQSEAEPGDTISATATPMGGSGKHTIAWEVYCGGTLVREKTPFDNQLNMSFTPEQEGEYFFRAYLYDGEQQVYGDSAVITVKKGECQHTNVQETLGSSVYNSVSDTTHELSITWVTVCQDCGSQRSQRVETQTLAHTFVNGACTECGSLDGSGPCKHTNVVSTETGTRMYSITTLQHVIETYYRDECADCGMTIIESRVSPREEAHQIVNGSCVCGYVQPSEECDHVNQTDVLTGESYVSASATQHEVIRTYKVTCDDCSQVVNANKTTSEMAAHALDANAYCPLCGYSGQCAHSKTKDVWQYDSYAPLPDGKKHTKTEVYSRFCADPDCGQLLLAADPSLSKTKEEKHKYDDDECRFCGYVRAKAFAVTITLDQTQAAKGDTIGAQAKPVGGSGVDSFYWEAYCDGALVSSSSTAQTHFTCTASVEGSWLFRAIVRDTVNGESLAAQSGVLIVSGCDHTPTTVPTGRTTVERNWDDDGNTHIAITPSHTSCECGLININEDVRQPVKHDYTYYSGVQALHEDQGHALFERCACGVARTTGVYQPTLDGCEKCAEKVDISDDLLDKAEELEEMYTYIRNNPKQVKMIGGSSNANLGKELRALTTLSLSGLENAEKEAADYYGNFLWHLAGSTYSVVTSLGMSAVDALCIDYDQQLLEQAIVACLYNAGDLGNIDDMQNTQTLLGGAIDVSSELLDQGFDASSVELSKIAKELSNDYYEMVYAIMYNKGIIDGAGKVNPKYHADYITYMESPRLHSSEHLQLIKQDYANIQHNAGPKSNFKYTENAYGTKYIIDNENSFVVDNAKLNSADNLIDIQNKQSTTIKNQEMTGHYLDILSFGIEIYLNAVQYQQEMKKYDYVVLDLNRKLHIIEVLCNATTGQTKEACKQIKKDLQKNFNGWMNSPEGRMMFYEDSKAGAELVLTFSGGFAVKFLPMQTAQVASGALHTAGAIVGTLGLANFGAWVLTLGGTAAANDVLECRNQLMRSEYLKTYIASDIYKTSDIESRYYLSELYYAMVSNELDIADNYYRLSNQTVFNHNDKGAFLWEEVIEAERHTLLDRQNNVRKAYFGNNVQLSNPYDDYIVSEEEYDALVMQRIMEEINDEGYAGDKIILP